MCRLSSTAVWLSGVLLLFNVGCAYGCTNVSLNYAGYDYLTVSLAEGESQTYCISLEEHQFLYILGNSKTNLSCHEANNPNITYPTQYDYKERQYLLIEPEILAQKEDTTCRDSDSYPCAFIFRVSHDLDYTAALTIKIWKSEMLRPNEKLKFKLDQYDRKRYGYRLKDKDLDVLVRMKPNPKKSKMDLDLFAYTAYESSYFYPNDGDRNYNKNYREVLKIDSGNRYYFGDGSFYMFEVYAPKETKYESNNRYSIRLIANYTPTDWLRLILLIFISVVTATFLCGICCSLLLAYRNRILYCFRIRSTPYPNGASNRQIRKLNKCQFQDLTETDTYDPSCAICLCDFESEDEITVLRCKHYFHVECAHEWLRINKVCPLCQQDIEMASDKHLFQESCVENPRHVQIEMALEGSKASDSDLDAGAAQPLGYSPIR